MAIGDDPAGHGKLVLLWGSLCNTASRTKWGGDGMWAVVPVKRLGDAKQRLASVLGPDERRALFRAMLEDVLAVLTSTTGLDGIAVVSSDAEVAALAAQYGARLIADGVDQGHTAAVTAGARRLASEGVDAIFTLPGDCPQVAPAETSSSTGASKAQTETETRPQLLSLTAGTWPLRPLLPT